MKLSIGQKLVGAFTIVLIILGVTTLVTNWEIGRVNDAYQEILENDVQKLIEINNMKALMQDETNHVRGYLLTGDEKYLENYKQSTIEMKALVKDVLSREKTAAGKKLLNDISDAEKAYQQAADRQLHYKQSGSEEEYMTILKATEAGIGRTFTEKMVMYKDYQEKQMIEIKKVENNKTNRIQLIVLIVDLAGVLIGIGFSITLGRHISLPIRKTSAAIEEVANGDLTIQTIKVKNHDEIGTLVSSMNKMVHDLRSVVKLVHESSEQVASSSEELSASAEQSNLAAKQVARLTEGNAVLIDKQAFELDHISESIEEMTAGIHAISSSGDKMEKAADTASLVSKAGMEKVENVVQQMEAIHESVKDASYMIESLGHRSDEISKIVGMITSIADQTNLLALNAAIEAARAGEHGKGFAVVADEVRKLAEESKKSAEQISSMISVIQDETSKAVELMAAGNKKTAAGMRQTQEVNDAFIQITGSVGNVSEKVQDVSTAVEQLSVSSAHIVQAVLQVKHFSIESMAASQESSAATEQQLAAMEEIASSSESLSHLSEELQALVRKFTV